MLHRIYSCAHIIRFDEKFFSIDCTDRVTHTYIYRFSTIYRESSPRVVRAFPSTLLLFTYSKYEVLSLVRNQCDIFIVEGCACVCARSMLGKNWNLDFLKLRYYIDSNGGVRLYKLRIILTGDEG